MPVNTPDIKVANVKRLGGQVELVGESYQEAQAYAQVSRQGNSSHACLVLVAQGLGFQQRAAALQNIWTATSPQCQ